MPQKTTGNPGPSDPRSTRSTESFTAASTGGLFRTPPGAVRRTGKTPAVGTPTDSDTEDKNGIRITLPSAHRADPKANFIPPFPTPLFFFLAGYMAATK